MKRLVALFVVAAVGLVACIGTTGGELVTFRSHAAGIASANGPMTFANGRGWTVTLTRATLHIGALYLNRATPVSGGQERECLLPGTYVAQVLRGRDIDVLSASPQEFPGGGTGTADLAITGEVWLGGTRFDDPEDTTDVVVVAGTATRGAESFAFEGTIRINEKAYHAPPANDPARPGNEPLCAERIIRPIPIAVTPESSGSLLVRVDPREWFANVDFAELTPIEGTTVRQIARSSAGADEASLRLYDGVRSAGNAYTFEWLP